jgi:hypothetical protein
MNLMNMERDTDTDAPGNGLMKMPDFDSRSVRPALEWKKTRDAGNRNSDDIRHFFASHST